VTAGYQVAAGCVFTVAALVFLYKAFSTPVLGPGQRDIIHFVCAFCAGAAGAFFTGAALLTLSADIGDTGKLAFQGTAGVAPFLRWSLYSFDSAIKNSPLWGRTVLGSRLAARIHFAR
jgi:hypothetical protein